MTQANDMKKDQQSFTAQMTSKKYGNNQFSFYFNHKSEEKAAKKAEKGGKDQEAEDDEEAKQTNRPKKSKTLTVKSLSEDLAPKTNSSAVF